MGEEIDNDNIPIPHVHLLTYPQRYEQISLQPY